MEEEEWARRNASHWRCPFFKYYWEEGIKLPTIDNCPECNNCYQSSQSSKRPRFHDREKRPMGREHHPYHNQRVSVYDRLGGKASVHDRLGGKHRGNQTSNNQVEEMANNRVPDKDRYDAGRL